MNQPLFEDPYWPRASAWLKGETIDPVSGRLAVIGAPVRLGSITPGRTDLAPAAVRSILRKFSTWDLESGIDLRQLEVVDRGDLDLAEAKLEDAFSPLSAAVKKALSDCDAAVVLGGDNGVTRPAVHGLGPPLDRCGLITIDAHFDLRDLSKGLTNGNPVRALIEDGLPGENIIQIGLQPFANSQAYHQVALDAGITVIPMSRVREAGIASIIDQAFDQLAGRVDALHVDLDIDALDRIFAPATPGSRPGGLTPWEMQYIARKCGEHPTVRSIDLVEVDPTQDVADTTVMTTASCLLAFACGLVRRLNTKTPG
ncbi:MAG: agmatinase family protein [Acidobacteriota bacterium]|nr:MAG: agmatinase family protein [Acidobacteriota bacterium]